MILVGGTYWKALVKGTIFAEKISLKMVVLAVHIIHPRLYMPRSVQEECLVKPDSVCEGLN